MDCERTSSLHMPPSPFSSHKHCLKNGSDGRNSSTLACVDHLWIEQTNPGVSFESSYWMNEKNTGIIRQDSRGILCGTTDLGKSPDAATWWHCKTVKIVGQGELMVFGPLQGMTSCGTPGHDLAQATWHYGEWLVWRNAAWNRVNVVVPQN